LDIGRLLSKKRKCHKTSFLIQFPSCGRFIQEASREIPFRHETHPYRLPGALLTTGEAADYLAIAPETLRRLCRQKAITFIQPTPSEYRFALADLEEYVSSRRNKRASGVR
jgi:excisionase family DNA binding protein